MPLCTLEINEADYRTYQDQVPQVCDEVLDRTLDGLDIPDPSDRETRIVISDKPGVRLNVSFTCGSAEYPEFTPEVFDPSPEQIHQTALEIKGSNYPFEVSQVSMESWRDTTFEMVDSDVEIPSLESLEERYFTQALEPTVTVAMLPAELSVAPEGEPAKEFGNEVGQEILDLLRESLPEGIVGQVNLITPVKADTDTSVEIDFPDGDGQSFSQDDREYMAQKVLAYLNQKGSTKDGSFEVWVRQGKPTIDTVAD